MELAVDIGLTQIIVLIRQLSFENKVFLKNEIEKELSEIQPQDADLTKLLLEGPVMSDNEYEAYKSNHKVFSKWTEKLFA